MESDLDEPTSNLDIAGTAGPNVDASDNNDGEAHVEDGRQNNTSIDYSRR